LLPSPATAPIW